MKPHNIDKRFEPYIRKTIMDIMDSQITYGDSDCSGVSIKEIQYEPRYNTAIACRYCGVLNSRDYEQYRCTACGAPLFDTGAR